MKVYVLVRVDDPQSKLVEIIGIFTKIRAAEDMREELSSKYSSGYAENKGKYLGIKEYEIY